MDCCVVLFDDVHQYSDLTRSFVCAWWRHWQTIPSQWHRIYMIVWTGTIASHCVTQREWEYLRCMPHVDCGVASRRGEDWELDVALGEKSCSTCSEHACPGIWLIDSKMCENTDILVTRTLSDCNCLFWRLLYSDGYHVTVIMFSFAVVTVARTVPWLSGYCNIMCDEFYMWREYVTVLVTKWSNTRTNFTLELHHDLCALNASFHTSDQ